MQGVLICDQYNNFVS